MGDTPTTTNTAVTVADGIIKAAIYNVAINGLITTAVATYPVLGWPVIFQIFKAICNKFGDKVYESLSQVANFQIIDLETDAEKKAVTASVAVLQHAISTGDANAITKAQQDFEANLGRLIHWDGS